MAVCLLSVQTVWCNLGHRLQEAATQQDAIALQSVLANCYWLGNFVGEA